MSNAVATIESRNMIQSTTPADLLRIAVEGGQDMDRLEKLMALQERWEANEARKAYTAAMAAFKAEPMAIAKDKHVRFTTQKGVTEYDHATLGNVVRTIVGGLGRHGLSHAWATKRLEGGRIEVTCRITHALGHSESIALDAAPDDSGGKNNIQALGSAITYLQRYTLLAITGLATDEQGYDDDGIASGGRYESDDGQAASWLDAIDSATETVDLDRIAGELKEQTAIPAESMKAIRKAWAAKAKAVKVTKPDRDAGPIINDIDEAIDRSKARGS